MKKEKKDFWVSYKEIKEKISLKTVLEKYQVFDKLKLSGKNYVGSCPIHKGTNTRQFSVNLERNIWQCFGDCQAGGNVLDFVASMENVNIRQAALKLRDWFLVGGTMPVEIQKKGRESVGKGKNEENKPLSFELKNLQTDHPFFTEKGINPETIRYFGLGYCAKGLMKNRIAIPLYNCKNELIGYCGRAIDKEQEEREGKYKLPPKFEKKQVLYNLNSQVKPMPSVILVESFLSVWKLFQVGFPNAVSLLGSVFSPEQEILLKEYLSSNSLIYLMFDNDESGQKCQKECLSRLGKKFFVKNPEYSEFGQKPHHLSEDTLKKLL